MCSASVHVVPQLMQLLSEPDVLPTDAVLYAVRPWTAGTDAVLIEGDKAPDGYEHLLEVDLVLEVLEVWSAWRGGLPRQRRKPRMRSSTTPNATTPIRVQCANP